MTKKQINRKETPMNKVVDLQWTLRSTARKVKMRIDANESFWINLTGG